MKISSEEKMKFEETELDIKQYVFERALNRPKTNLYHIGLYCLIYVIISFCIAYTIIGLFYLEEIKLWIYVGVYFIIFLFIAKSFFIRLVECYQHYAPEKIRRRCLCKPTCSEYAIIVLNKYWLPIAVFKILKRLLITCKGKYKVDNP